MTMLSKACEYAIRACLYIAYRSEQNLFVSLKEVAAGIDSPEAYTAKILQKLARNGIIGSMKGPGGGFQMDPGMCRRICLSDIVEAIDGKELFTGCGLGLKECDESKPCPAHDEFKVVRDHLTAMLKNTTLDHLTGELKGGITFLK